MIPQNNTTENEIAGQNFSTDPECSEVQEYSCIEKGGASQKHLDCEQPEEHVFGVWHPQVCEEHLSDSDEDVQHEVDDADRDAPS